MKYLIPVFVLVFLGFPLIVQAQECNALAEFPSSQKLCNLLMYIHDILYILAGGIALIVILISGIQYMTAGGDETKVTKARKTLTYGLVGAAIVLASAFIVNALKEVILRGLLY